MADDTFRPARPPPPTPEPVPQVAQDAEEIALLADLEWHQANRAARIAEWQAVGEYFASQA